MSSSLVRFREIALETIKSIRLRVLNKFNRMKPKIPSEATANGYQLTFEDKRGQFGHLFTLKNICKPNFKSESQMFSSEKAETD